MTTTRRHEVPNGWSAARAAHYAQGIVDFVSPHDREEGMRIIETRYGIGFWQLWHLVKGKAKKCDIALYGKIYEAYLHLCEQQINKLQHELKSGRAKGNDTFEDLEREAAALAQKVADRRAMSS